MSKSDIKAILSKSDINQKVQVPTSRVFYLCYGTFAAQVCAQIRRSTRSLPVEVRRQVRFQAFDVLPSPPAGLDDQTYMSLGKGVSPQELVPLLDKLEYSFLRPWFEKIQGDVMPSLEEGARQPAYAMIGFLTHLKEVYQSMVRHLRALTQLDPDSSSEGPVHVVTVGNAYRSVGPVGLLIGPALIRKAMEEAAPVREEERLFSAIVVVPPADETQESLAVAYETLMELNYMSISGRELRLEVPVGFDPKGVLTCPTPLYQYLYLRSPMTAEGRSLGPVENMVTPVAREALQLGLGSLGLEQRTRRNNIVELIGREVESDEIF